MIRELLDAGEVIVADEEFIIEEEGVYIIQSLFTNMNKSIIITRQPWTNRYSWKLEKAM